MKNLTMPYQEGLDFGLGVDSATGNRRQQGADGTPEKVLAGISGGDGSFSLVRIEDTHELETHLGISAEASGGAGPFSASARFDFAKDSKVQSNSTTLLMMCTKSFGFTQIRKPTLDAEAAKLVATGNAELFAERYGDYFVAGIESGGQFFGIIKIEYASESDKTNISAKVAGSYGLFSAQVSMNLSSAIKDTHSQVTASLYYQGGNVSTAVKTPDDLFTAKSEWESTVLTSAKPYSVLLLPWVVADGPLPPNAADLQHQKDVLVACAKLRSQTLDKLNSIEYVLDSNSQSFFQFKPGDGDRLSKLHADLSLDADIIEQAASFAIDNAKLAVEPETYARTIKAMTDYHIHVLLPSDLPPLVAGTQIAPNLIGMTLASLDQLRIVYNDISGDDIGGQYFDDVRNLLGGYTDQDNVLVPIHSASQIVVAAQEPAAGTLIPVGSPVTVGFNFAPGVS